MQPFDDTVDDKLTYGFAAFTSGSEEATDCACYFAEFAHDEKGQPIKRNKLIFQVANTGSDVQSENIDLQIPGGGMGIFTQGCPAQWKTPAQQWGAQYGGVSSASQCSNLPDALQEGCKWRFSSWGPNPVLKSKPQRVKCPMALIDRSGCQRKDENTISAYKGETMEKGKAAEAKYKRDRSVCLAGGQRQGYGPIPGSGAGGSGAGAGSGTPEGYGSQPGRGSATAPGPGAGQQGGDAGSGGSPDAGSGSGVEAPAPDLTKLPFLSLMTILVTTEMLLSQAIKPALLLHLDLILKTWLDSRGLRS